MKLSRLIVAATLTLTAVTGSVSVSHAADATAAAKARVTPARIDLLTAELGLSAEQAAAIKPLLAARADELKAIRTNMALDESAKKSATSAAMATYGESIRSHLTYVQQARYSMLIRREAGQKPARIDVLTATLGLSENQVVEIAPLLKARSAALVAITRDAQMDDVAKQGAKAEMMKDYGARIRAQMTTEQRAAYRALIKAEALAQN